MSAIAGYISNGAQRLPERACRDMLAALVAYGADANDVLAIGDLAFGRNLHKALPEDDFDHQPIVGGGGRYLLVADARIDNRVELATKLGIAVSAASVMSDSALLMAAWERWQVGSHDEVLGDYAFGVWDFEESSLTLVRSAFSLKPLFYHVHPRFTAFASMPAGLHALASIPKRIHFQHAAAIAAQFSYLGSSTIFEGINQVRHGHAVRLKVNREETILLLDLDESPSFRSSADHGDALRAEFDRAVGAQLRRHHGPAASQLSSGRDSSAVTTSAARVLASRGEELLAFTGAPRADFPMTELAGRLADESSLAAKTAAFHDNIRHFVCRSDRGSAIPFLKPLNEHHHGPMINVTNLRWWAKINVEAAARGAQVLLTGSTGNFSISAGGVNHLRDLLLQQGTWAWMKQALSMGRLSPSSWRTIAKVTFGPLLPRSAYQLVLKAMGRWPSDSFDVPILRSPYRESAEALLREQWGDLRPPMSYFDFRKKLLLQRDNPDMMSLGCWGIEPRDPTSDRRLVQLCLSFPAQKLVSSTSTRPIFEAAFQDRIPNDVLHSSKRGYQGADWFEHFRKNDVREAFRAYGQNAIVGELLNLDYIDELIAAWPTGGWDRTEVLGTYRNTLLGALALASFIDVHFPD